MSENATESSPSWVISFGSALSRFDLIADEDLAVWQAIAALSRDDATFYELACGLGEPTDVAYLRTHVYTEGDITVWRLTARDDESAPLGFAVYSAYTQAHRLSIWFWQPGAASWEVWAEALAALVQHMFVHRPSIEHVFVHLPLPVDDAQHDALMRQGFEIWGTEWLLKKPERALYGLSRQVFDLYRQDVVDDDEGLSV